MTQKESFYRDEILKQREVVQEYKEKESTEHLSSDEGVSFLDVVISELHYLRMLLSSDEIGMAITRIEDLIYIIESREESRCADE